MLKPDVGFVKVYHIREVQEDIFFIILKLLLLKTTTNGLANAFPLPDCLQEMYKNSVYGTSVDGINI